MKKLPRVGLKTLLTAFRSVLANVEADGRLTHAERADQFAPLWDRAVRSGATVNHPGTRPIWYELTIWDLGPRRATPGSQRDESRWDLDWLIQSGSGRTDVEQEWDRQALAAYLVRRLDETPSPIHSARYADLLWEIRGGYQQALVAAQAYLDSLPLMNRKMQAEDFHDGILRALSLGVRLNKPRLVAAAKEALLEELSQSKVDGYDAYALELLPWLYEIPKRWVTAEDLEYGRQYAKEAARHYRATGGEDLFFAPEAARHAARFAQLLGDQAGEWSFLLEAGAALEDQASSHGNDSHLVEAHFLEEALKHYTAIGASDRLDDLRRRIRQAYRLADPEFAKADTSVSFDTAEIDAFADALAGLAPAESLAQFIAWGDRVRIPSKGRAEQAAREASGRYPLSFGIMPRAIIVDGRRVTAADDSEQAREHANLCSVYSTYVQVGSAVLAHIYRRLADAGRWTADSIADFLMTGVAFDEDKLPLLRTGLERYFARDYISAIHVLVPQIESILRRLREKLGLPTTTVRSGVTMEVSLGDVLETPQIADGLGEDLSFYLRFLLTEQQGENLRNDVAHGLFGEQRAREPLATLVVDIFLILRTIAITPATEASTSGTSRSESVLRIVRDIPPERGHEARVEPSGREPPRPAWIRVIADRIAREFHPLQVILFGSYARGEARPDSDVDLLVVLPSVEDARLQVVQMKKALSDLPLAADIIVATPDEIESRKDVISDVVYDAIREGRVLFDRE